MTTLLTLSASTGDEKMEAIKKTAGDYSPLEILEGIEQTKTITWIVAQLDSLGVKYTRESGSLKVCSDNRPQGWNSSTKNARVIVARAQVRVFVCVCLFAWLY